MNAFVRVDNQIENIKFKKVDVPVIDPTEVLVKVRAFGVGVHDKYFIPKNVTYPYPIGFEATGVIVNKGRDVSGVDLGDRVILSSALQPKGGCWAEYVAVSTEMLVTLPDEIDFCEGATLPVAGKTALESLEAVNLKKGDTLFVAGASGAIGTFLIQMAKNKGLRIIASASSKNHAHMLSLGAEQAVDYSDLHWKEHVKEWEPEGVDAAVAIQPKTGKDSMDMVKAGGTMLTVSGDRVDPKRNIRVQQLHHNIGFSQAMKWLITEIQSGKITPVIEKIYRFKQALNALEKVEFGHARGKLTQTHVKELITNKKTKNKIKGFKSKKGSSFSAYVELNDEYKTQFKF